jgi:hypothetical protein
MPDKNQMMEKQTNNLQRMDSLQKIEHVGKQICSIKTLQQAYNNIMDILEPSDTKVRYDPIDKLPPEIFGAIVHEAVGSFQTYQLDNTLILTLVSKRWRDFILGTPLLWTNIDVYPRQHDFLARISLSLELSKDLPISLRLVSPLTNWDTILALLLRSRRRIQRINIPNSTSYDIKPLLHQENGKWPPRAS